MSAGTVKWFNGAKGKENQKVQFEIAQGPKGTHAVNIRPAE